MMSDEIYSGRSSNYWYIDLRHAVNVILLRVFQMKEILNQRQEAKAAHQACGSVVSSLLLLIAVPVGTAIIVVGDVVVAVV